MNDSGMLYGISIVVWVIGTVRKMRESGLSDKSTWNDCWGRTYDELEGKSAESRNEPCPRAAAYGLWNLGRIRDGGRPITAMTIPEIGDSLGKNAAYALIALGILQGGQPEWEPNQLWELVQSQYRLQFNEEPAKNPHGQTEIVISLCRAGHIAS